MLKVIVLISGRGSNLKSLIDQAANYQITHVVSDYADASGQDYAREANIPFSGFSRQAYSSKKEHRQAIYSLIRELDFDYIVLAGFMQILPADFVQEYHNRIINIHPSLLPLLPGLNTHQRAIAENYKTHGCTVHFVNEDIDAGARIAAAEVQVKEDDTAETLAERVLKREHSLYPWVINNLAQKNFKIQASTVTYSEQMQQDAKQANFLLNC